MVYLPTFGLFSCKCRLIYHTWIVWVLSHYYYSAESTTYFGIHLLVQKMSLVPLNLTQVDFHYPLKTSSWSKVVSTHLWNTPLNLYQKAISRDFFHDWRCRGIAERVCDIGVCWNNLRNEVMISASYWQTLLPAWIVPMSKLWPWSLSEIGSKCTHRIHVMYGIWNMDVSKNRATPKWMVYNGKPY